MIPDYQTLMLPLLKLISDGKEYKLNEAVELLATQYNLTNEEKSELLPSGKSLVFTNRLGWAKTYLKKSGLIDAPKRGVITITDRGKNTLKENLSEISVKYLKKFPEFLMFQSAKKEESEIIITEELKQKETPDELLENGYQSIRKSLEQEILARLKQYIHLSLKKLLLNFL